jgi:uncharacterized membrane protein YkgB
MEENPMHEVMEAHEAHEHKGEPFTLRVAVTMSILAVLVAIATLLGHRSATEKVVSQALASDQWSFYQAKNIRLREMQGVADMLGTVAPIDKEKAEALREKYLKEVERYEKEKDEISEKAKDLEKERDVFGRKEDRFDASEVILEIGLIICSLTLLTQKRIFWFSGMVLGVIGFFVTVSGFLIH